MVTRAGVLALQGGAEPHLAALQRLGCDAQAVRAPADLDGLTHLVLPGGESTAIRRLLDLFDLAAPIVAAHRAGRLALFGTCAGAILLGADDGERPARLGLLDATLARNAHGTQVDSFAAPVALDDGSTLRGVFIRAPRFARVGAGARVIARLDDEPVAVAAPGLLAATFHPELAGDDRLHARFLAA